MKVLHRRALLFLAVAATALAACGSSSTKASTSDNSSSTSMTTAAAAATVSASMNASKGDILVDAQGMTLYRNDTEAGGVIKCTGACATAWPPLLATGTPVAGAGIGHTLGTIMRPDGTTQVTEDSWPLYHFAADKAAGDTKGDGVGGIWHVVPTSGTSTTTAPAAPAATTATTAGSGGYGY